MTQAEMKEDFYQDMLADQAQDRQDQILEYKLRTDYDYARDYLITHKTLTAVHELSAYVSRLNSYGHEVTCQEVLEELL